MIRLMDLKFLFSREIMSRGNSIWIRLTHSGINEFYFDILEKRRSEEEWTVFDHLMQLAYTITISFSKDDSVFI